jgi:hypothetical protein
MMVVAFDPREKLLDVVQAADEALPKVKAFGPKAPGPSCRFVEGIEPGAQRIVDNRLERLPALLHLTLEPHRHIIIQG